MVYWILKITDKKYYGACGKISCLEDAYVFNHFEEAEDYQETYGGIIVECKVTYKEVYPHDCTSA